MKEKWDTFLTERDIKIFELIKKIGWVREDFIAKYLQLDWNNIKTKHNLYALGIRLIKHNFITKIKVIEGYPAYWGLAKKGAEFMNSIEQSVIKLATLKHNDMVAELAIDIMTNNPETELDTEYQLKQEIYGRSSKNVKFPDIIINEKIAIEVEVSRKNDSKLSAIVSRYLSSQYEEIIYYTNSAGIAKKIKLLSQNNPKFQFKIFNGLEILSSKAYYPIVEINDKFFKINSGQFVSSIDKKLSELGAFN